MKTKNSRIEALKMLISSQDLCSQDEVLQALQKEGFELTQATLSRDMKQLKVAKAASMNGKYIYVLPNETMYRRVPTPKKAMEMLQTPGFMSLNISGNMAVIKTRPGYASAIAYNIDNANIDSILGTIAGDEALVEALFRACVKFEVFKVDNKGRRHVRMVNNSSLHFILNFGGNPQRLNPFSSRNITSQPDGTISVTVDNLFVPTEAQHPTYTIKL